MRVVLILFIVALAGCSTSNRINNYEARLKTQDGTDYQIFNKRGSLLQIERPDGTKITADDRGHPEPAGLLRELLGIWAIGAIDKTND